MARILCNVAGGGKPLKGNAEPGDVLAGKTFSNKQSNALTGTMPNNGTNKNAVSVGGGSGSLYAYMPYGYYDDYNNYGNAWINITDDQAKTLANNAGVGYNSGYAKGVTNGKSDARLVLISRTYFGDYETKTINISSGILIWQGDVKKYDCFMKNQSSVTHLINAYAMNQDSNGNPISLQSATDTTVTFYGLYGTLSAYQIQ